MSILKLIASSSFLTVNKEIARKLSLESAVLFADLASAQIYWNDKEGAEDTWFFRTREVIEQETTLKKRKQLNAYNNLKKNNLIKEKIAGCPAKKYYLIDEECTNNLHTLLCQNETADCDEMKQLGVANQHDINKNKENKNKLNNKTIKKDSKKNEVEAVPVSDSSSLQTPKNKKEKVAPKRKKLDIDSVEFPAVFLQHPELIEAFKDFFQMRKEIKKGYKTRKAVETKLRSLAKDCERHGVETVIGAILFSLESEYLGIFVHDYAKKQQQNEKQSTNYAKPKPTNIHEDFKRRLQERLNKRLSAIDDTDGTN
jgi:hypothetical protein